MLDGVIQVDAEPAREYARRCAREGHAGRHFLGRHPVRHCAEAPRTAAGSRVLGFNYDTGERYLSVEGFPAFLMKTAATLVDKALAAIFI